jgi:hypothetical protein
MQSRTVFQALTTQLSFRVFNFTALILIIAWAFSPLGSQASLRIVSTGRHLNSSSSIVTHQDSITNQIFDSVSGVESLVTSLKPAYISSVLGSDSVKNGSMDLQGNVKIPWLVSSGVADVDGWVNIPRA